MIKNINTSKKFFECDYNITMLDYKEMCKCFKLDLFYPWILIGTIFAFIITYILSFFYNNINILIFFSFFELVILIIFYLNLINWELHKFKKNKNSKYYILNGHLLFYDSYLVISNNNASVRNDYFNFDKCIETETNFYLKYANSNNVIIINKKNCNSDLNNFICNKFKNILKKGK